MTFIKDEVQPKCMCWYWSLKFACQVIGLDPTFCKTIRFHLIIFCERLIRSSGYGLLIISILDESCNNSWPVLDCKINEETKKSNHYYTNKVFFAPSPAELRSFVFNTFALGFNIKALIVEALSSTLRSSMFMLF